MSKTARHLDPVIQHILDGLPHGAAFHDLDGQEWWRNQWLDQAYREPAGCRLVRAVADFVRDGQWESPRTQHLPIELRPAVAISGRVVEAGLPGGGTAILVCVTGSVEPAAAASARFGLTPAETRVAAYLAEGVTTKRIASALAISPHTVRRHTENVLRKLKVHSRSEVAETLRQASHEADPVTRSPLLQAPGRRSLRLVS